MLFRNGQSLMNTIVIPVTTSGDSEPININISTMTRKKQEGHDGPVALHWLIREIHSYQTLHYLGIGLKHKTPCKD